MKGLLRKLLGLDTGHPTPPNSTPTVQPPSPTPTHPFQPTESYLKRKKGPKLRHESHKDLTRIIECVERLGEAKPGDIAKELGMARSSLAYSLNRIMAFSNGTLVIKYRYDPLPDTLGKALAGRRFERLGAGQSVRYRLAPAPPKPEA